MSWTGGTKRRSDARGKGASRTKNTQRDGVTVIFL